MMRSAEGCWTWRAYLVLKTAPCIGIMPLEPELSLCVSSVDEKYEVAAPSTGPREP